MHLPDATLRRLRRQHGVVTRAQLLVDGIAPSTVDDRVRRAVLEPVERGVYRVRGGVGTAEQRLSAAVLRAGPGARLTGWSACALYALEGVAQLDPPWVAVPPRRRVRGVAWPVHRTTIPPCDRATIAGLPGVTPVRALLDVAMRVRGRRLRVGIDDARRRRLVVLPRLLDRAVALGGHAGATTVRRLFAAGSLDQDGELERALALALASADLRPAWGVEVLPRVTVDACFPEASYVLECDGARWHTIDPDRAADLSREGVLRADGWKVERVRADDLRDRRDELLIRIVATRAARAEAGLGRAPDWQPVHPGRRLRPPTATRP